MTANPIHQLHTSKRIADPVHGLIRLTSLEAQVLQHPVFQRLREVTQLGITKYVYPGAMHNRFSHSLGVLHTSTQIFDAAYRNWHRTPDLSGSIDAENVFSEYILQATRLAAMCHDLGHFPFSHNLELPIDWMEEKRVIPRSFTHENLSALLVREVLGPTLNEYTDIVAGIIDSNFQPLKRCLFPAYVVSSAIDADRMDYLIRDALHCGVDQGNYDKERLLDSILTFSANINGSDYDVMGFRSKGIEAIEQFLLARHRMHQTVYFNPTVVGFEASLKRAYYLISSNNPPWELPQAFIEDPELFIGFDEALFFSQLKQQLKQRESWLVDPLVHRTPLNKVGPYYYTVGMHGSTSSYDQERFSVLRSISYELEDPASDWYQRDHWVMVENKRQTLVDPLPQSVISSNDGFEDMSSLKNMILLINANGDLVDPTRASYGHTFLPFITGHTYHRFLFYSHKRDADKIRKIVQPIDDQFKDIQSR